MIIFNLTMRYESMDKRIDDRDTLNPEIDKKKFNELMSCANDNLGRECGLDGNMSAFIVGGRTGTIEMKLSFRIKNPVLNIFVFPFFFLTFFFAGDILDLSNYTKTTGTLYIIIKGRRMKT